VPGPPYRDALTNVAGALRAAAKAAERGNARKAGRRSVHERPASFWAPPVTPDLSFDEEAGEAPLPSAGERWTLPLACRQAALSLRSN